MAQLPKAPALGQASLGAGGGENLPGAGVRSVRRMRPGRNPSPRSQEHFAKSKQTAGHLLRKESQLFVLVSHFFVAGGEGVAGRQGLNSQCQGGWA